MPTSPLHGWTTPDGSEEPQVHLDLESLAAQIDADTPVTAAAGPSHREGRVWYDTVNDVVSTSNGSAWTKLISGARMINGGTAGGVTDGNGYLPAQGHSLGAAPDFVIITLAPGGSDTVSSLMKAFVSSITSSAFQVRVSRTDTNAWFAGNGFSYYWLAGRM